MTWKKVDEILQQVSEMTTQLHQLSDAVRKFEKCKACKKKYNRSVDDGEVRFEDKPSSLELTPPLCLATTKRSALKQSTFMFNTFATGKDPHLKAD